MIIEQCCATSAEGQADLVLSLRASPSLIRRDPILLVRCLRIRTGIDFAAGTWLRAALVP
jgi:hypothetical protein